MGQCGGHPHQSYQGSLVCGRGGGVGALGQAHPRKRQGELGEKNHFPCIEKRVTVGNKKQLRRRKQQGQLSLKCHVRTEIRFRKLRRACLGWRCHTADRLPVRAVAEEGPAVACP